MALNKYQTVQKYFSLDDSNPDELCEDRLKDIVNRVFSAVYGSNSNDIHRAMLSTKEHFDNGWKTPEEFGKFVDIELGAFLWDANKIVEQPVLLILGLRLLLAHNVLIRTFIEGCKICFPHNEFYGVFHNVWPYAQLSDEKFMIPDECYYNGAIFFKSTALPNLVHKYDLYRSRTRVDIMADKHALVQRLYDIIHFPGETKPEFLHEKHQNAYDTKTSCRFSDALIETSSNDELIEEIMHITKKQRVSR